MLEKVKRLNFGAGSILPDSWLNVDKDASFGAEYTLDAVDGLPFDDDSIDYIVAHHSIQQIPYNDLVTAFKELRRVLKPGGIFRISIPDILGGFKAYQLNNKEWFPNHQNHQTIDGAFCSWLSWYSTNITPLVCEAVADMLIESEFKDVYRLDFNRTMSGDSDITSLDSREPESIFIEARK